MHTFLIKGIVIPLISVSAITPILLVGLKGLYFLYYSSKITSACSMMMPKPHLISIAPTS